MVELLIFLAVIILIGVWMFMCPTDYIGRERGIED